MAPINKNISQKAAMLISGFKSRRLTFIEEGKIIQQGTHNELVNIDGYYKELYAKQLLEKEM